MFSATTNRDLCLLGQSRDLGTSSLGLMILESTVIVTVLHVDEEEEEEEEGLCWTSSKHVNLTTYSSVHDKKQKKQQHFE